MARSFLVEILYLTPSISLIPSIEISLTPELDEYYVATHVCLIGSGKDVYSSVVQFDSLRGKTLKLKKIIFPLGKEITRNTRQVTHSSLIKYTPPQHMLVTMSFTEERPLRQSVYDFIERTGACVEILFEEQTCSFEGFDQEAWKEGMEEVEEECKMIRSQESSGCEDLGDFYPAFASGYV
ncbi:hypothetical protein ADUPG1_013264 [Aduncisulcus paluster]|uniref:Uncharacterized protein n=1 Tax=Aduncisulcus paluster TaxID=2918883 RepID=A0ABQ5K5K0_9EUKA|nr:hypothetical protein ADUPG1_013264 [Aduncisulcus paluster]